MLMHSCWSIVFNMLSGFLFKLKRIQNSFENTFGNLIWKKKKKITFPFPPFLNFGPWPFSPSRQPTRPPPLPFLGRPSLGQATAATTPAQLAPQLPAP